MTRQLNINKRRILHILWSGKTGGAERFLTDIFLYSDRDKYEHIACFLSTKGCLADEIEKNGGRVFCLNMKGVFSFINAFKLIKILKLLKPDLINCHVRNYLTNIILIIFSNVPKVYFEHGGALIGGKSSKDEIFYKIFGRQYDLILANSSYVMDKITSILKIDSKKIKIYYIGVPIERYNIPRNTLLKEHLGIPENSRVIGTIGRLVESKGLDDYIKVCSEIEKNNNGNIKISYLIVGSGPKKKELEEMANEYGVNIKFLGERNDVPNLLSIFDVFLFTPKWEAFGIVLLEAMASKVPVVGFEVPGANEIFKNGGGVLIEGRDCQRLSLEIISLLNDKEKHNLIADQGYLNVVQHFDIKQRIIILEKEYKLLMENSGVNI